MRSIQLQTGGENHGYVCKLRSGCLDHSFRIGCDIHGTCRTSNTQLWRLVMDDDDQDQLNNKPLIWGFIILSILVLWAAATHGQL